MRKPLIANACDNASEQLFSTAINSDSFLPQSRDQSTSIRRVRVELASRGQSPDTSICASENIVLDPEPPENEAQPMGAKRRDSSSIDEILKNMREKRMRKSLLQNQRKYIGGHIVHKEAQQQMKTYVNPVLHKAVPSEQYTSISSKLKPMDNLNKDIELDLKNGEQSLGQITNNDQEYRRAQMRTLYNQLRLQSKSTARLSQDMGKENDMSISGKAEPMDIDQKLRRKAILEKLRANKPTVSRAKDSEESELAISVQRSDGAGQFKLETYVPLTE